MRPEETRSTSDQNLLQVYFPQGQNLKFYPRETKKMLKKSAIWQESRLKGLILPLKHMPQLARFGLQIFLVVRVAVCVQCDALYHFNSRLLKGGDFPGVVGHQAHGPDTQVFDHRPQQAVIPYVRPETQLLVGLNRIGTGVLQFIGPDLVQQSYSTTFLPEIKQGTAALLGDRFQRGLQLMAAVTAHAEQRISSEALGVNPHERVVAWLSQREGHVLDAVVFGDIPGGGMSSSQTTVSSYTKGTLIIDAYEPGEKKMVWRGTGTVTVKSKSEKQSQQIDNILKKLGNKWDKILAGKGK